MLDRGGNSFEIAHRAFAGVKIKNLTQRDIKRTNSAADRSSKRALDGHAKIADGFDGIVGQPFPKGVKGFFASENFVPGNFALAAIGLVDGCVENATRSFPDVAAGAIALDERNDRIVRHLQLAAAVVDRRPFLWNRLPVVSALHLAFSPPRRLDACEPVICHSVVRLSK